jgi:hypothetical protein
MKCEASPVTALLEASATAVGVGMVLGGFAAGLVGVLIGRPRDVLEGQVLKAGYFFAAFCLVMRWAEILKTI